MLQTEGNLEPPASSGKVAEDTPEDSLNVLASSPPAHEVGALGNR